MKSIVVTVLHYGDVLATLTCVGALLNELQGSSAFQWGMIISSNGTSEDDNAIQKWARGNFQSFFDVPVNSIQGFNGDLFFEDVIQCSALRSEAQCVLIRNEKNLGFAAGHNPAIKLAMMLGADAVWLLNNDAVVQQGALSGLWDCYKKTNGTSIIGTTVVDSSSPTVIQCAGGMTFNPYSTSVTAVLAGESVNRVGQLRATKFDYIYGASMCVPSQVFKDVGLLNEDFFLFYEELDFCRRAQKAGYSLEWCRNAVVTHRNNDEKADSELRIYHSVRSFTLFVRRHYPKYWLVMALVHAAGRSFVQIKAKSFLNICIIGKGFLQGCNTALKSNVNFFNQ